MPVRSLTSSVLRWPDRQTVDAAVRTSAARVAEARAQVVAVGYFGSYARGDRGVGSDVDLVVLVEQSELPFKARAAACDTTTLPVPAELVVYTVEEWDRLQLNPGFVRTVGRESVWLIDRAEAAVITASAVTALLLTGRSPSPWAFAVASALCLLAGLWATSTHVPLLIQAGQGTVLWGSALFHSTPGPIIMVVALFALLRALPALD